MCERAGRLNKGINIYENSPNNAYYQLTKNNIKIISKGSSSYDGGVGIYMEYVGQNNTTNLAGALVSNNKIFLDNRSTQSFANGIQPAGAHVGSLATLLRYVLFCSTPSS